MFKAGTRASATMQAVARGLSDGDIRELSVFFSQQHPPLATGCPAAFGEAGDGRQAARRMGAGAEILRASAVMRQAVKAMVRAFRLLPGARCVCR